MKTICFSLGILFAFVQLSIAGGNSSIVNLSKVTSIEVEDGKVTIIGDGMVKKRILSDKEHGDGTAFGQPAQMIHAKVENCKFQIVPYFSRSDISGVPGPSPDNLNAEMKELSKRQWDGLLETAKKIKPGDAITIGYQQDRMDIISVYIESILGSGSLSIDTK